MTPQRPPLTDFERQVAAALLPLLELVIKKRAEQSKPTDGKKAA